MVTQCKIANLLFQRPEIYSVHKNGTLKFGRKVENSKRSKFHRGNCGCKRMHDIVEDAVFPQFLMNMQIYI